MYLILKVCMACLPNFMNLNKEENGSCIKTHWDFQAICLSPSTFSPPATSVLLRKTREQTALVDSSKPFSKRPQSQKDIRQGKQGGPTPRPWLWSPSLLTHRLHCTWLLEEGNEQRFGVAEDVNGATSTRSSWQASYSSLTPAWASSAGPTLPPPQPHPFSFSPPTTNTFREEEQRSWTLRANGHLASSNLCSLPFSSAWLPSLPHFWLSTLY